MLRLSHCCGIGSTDIFAKRRLSGGYRIINLDRGRKYELSCSCPIPCAGGAGKKRLKTSGIADTYEQYTNLAGRELVYTIPAASYYYTLYRCEIRGHARKTSENERHLFSPPEIDGQHAGVVQVKELRFGIYCTHAVCSRGIG